MKRSDLEHIIRAAGAIAEVDELIIIGSQAILGMYPDAPPELLVSREADIYPMNNPDKADLIDGSIGENSLFDDVFGYYAHGVGPETAVLPNRWKDRLVPIKNNNTRGVTGWCLSAIDIAVSKLAAGRNRDIEFVKTMLKYNMVKYDDVINNTDSLPEEQKKLVIDRLSICRRRA